MKVHVLRPDETGATVAGYELGFVMSKRQKYASYTWPKIVKAAKKESGSNALQLELQILHWGADGQQLSPIYHEPPSDVRGAIRIATDLVAKGESMAEVRGKASRMHAMKGFGDRASVSIAMIERDA